MANLFIPAPLTDYSSLVEKWTAYLVVQCMQEQEPTSEEQAWHNALLLQQGKMYTGGRKDSKVFILMESKCICDWKTYLL